MTANLSTREACAAADERDPLRGFRDRFDLPEGVVYLDGNSLGPMPRGALERSAEVIGREWGRGLIRSWNDAGWFDLPTRLGDKLARIVGADQGTVVVTDTTSLNLFKVLAAALAQQRAHPERTVIVSERDNFPTDLYMAQGMIEFLDRGYELRLVDEALPLDAAVDERTAAVVLSHVNYRTGAMYDLAEVSGLAHDRGAIAIWDLAHSAGAVPVDLGGAAVDYAVGCTYKYLNAGPGGPAFAYVAPRHHGTLRQPLSGWWGHARPFAMETAFAADPGARGLLCGTQPMVSLALVECGLDIALEADIEAVRAKSLALTDLFITLVEQRCADHPLTLVTPREPARRGSHVSFRHPQGFAVMAALIDRGIIGDYREPQVLRFGVTPLYLRHTDVWDAVDGLRDILDTRSWDRSEFHRRGTVT